MIRVECLGFTEEEIIVKDIASLEKLIEIINKEQDFILESDVEAIYVIGRGLTTKLNEGKLRLKSKK